MAEEICTNLDQIEWRNWHRLAEKIDDLAVAVGVPSYSKLTEDENLPFIESNLPQVTAIQYFETTANGGCILVADRYLQVDFQGANVAWPGTPMTGAGGHAFYDAYITAGNLFFVHEEDHCWCKMIFKVTDANSTGISLAEAITPVFGCCGTTTVPEPGDLLDLNQTFIPAGYTCQYGGPNGYEPPITPIMYCPKCVPPNSGGCFELPNNNVEYNFEQDVNNDWIMTGTGRHVSGYLTWPILATHMDALFDKLESILACANNDGLRPAGITDETTYTGPPDSTNPTLWWDDDANDGDGYASHGGSTTAGWTVRGSACPAPESLQAWLSGIRFEFEQFAQGEMDVDENGTLVQTGTNYVYISNCSDVTEFDKPWETLTGNNSPANCGTTGKPKVYCETLNRMSELIEAVEARLWPVGTFAPDTSGESRTCLSGKNCCQYNSPFDITCTSLTAGECLEGFHPVTTCSTDCCLEEADCTDIDPDLTWDGCQCVAPSDRYCCCTFFDEDPEGAGYDCTYTVECVALADSAVLGADCSGDCTGPNDVGVVKAGVDITECITGSVNRSGWNGVFYDTFDCDEGTCNDAAQANPADYVYTPLTARTDSCNSCADADYPCCLLHTAFEGTTDGCVEYFEEINAFIKRATEDLVSCSYPDSGRASAGGLVNECDSIRCYTLCSSTLPASVENCINQAGIVWSIIEDINEAGIYYIEITAPTPPP